MWNTPIPEDEEEPCATCGEFAENCQCIVDWDCPDCGEPHSDPEGVETHCRKCGLIVTPYDGFTHDEGKYVADKASTIAEPKQAKKQ